jgi:2-acylglycerol O-acyltransferase 2
MIHNGDRFRPPTLRVARTRPRDPNAPIAIRPKSGIMSLNPEPADPQVRSSLDLPPKTYADAAEDGLENAGDGPIDEDAIKESPPRAKRHSRQTSEPRPLGEVMDEVEQVEKQRAGSPTLRHIRGRLEEKDSWEKDGHSHVDNGETYADAVKDHAPAKDNAILNGNGVPPAEFPGLVIATNGAKMNGPGEQATGSATAAKRAINGGTVTPETYEYEAVGQDGSPRSPVRTAHKRVSSRSLNGTAKKQQSQDENLSPRSRSIVSLDEETAEEGELVYENIQNKSGTNLASIKPSADYALSLAQREDKPPSSEPPKGTATSAATARERRNSAFTSGRRAGAGWSTSAIRWAPLNVPLQRRLQTLMVLAHTLSIAGSLAFFFLLCTIPLLWPILVPYLLYCLLSRASIDGELAHRSNWLRSSKVWSLFGGYFPARLHRSEVLEPTRKYIFGYHPHGIISHGAFAAFATEALGFAQLFPGITNTLLTLDSNFRIPLYRDYALRMGLASVSRESCENILSKGGPNGEGMGRAITIVIGGARESLDAKPYTLRLVLKRRKGFVKLAIRTGADLVPCLAFGENDLYEQFDAGAHPWVHKAQLLVKKCMGFTIPLFHARGMHNTPVVSFSWSATNILMCQASSTTTSA